MKAGWKLSRLGDVCSFEKAQGVHSGLPYIGLEHIESETAQFLGSLEPAEVKSSTFKFTDAHVLYGRLRPYLNKVLTPSFTGHCSTEIFPIAPKPELQRDYLRYWLQFGETVQKINSTCTGARMPRADMNEVLNFYIPLPPLPDQKRIVAILDEALSGITTAHAAADQNRQNARALFESHLQEVFSLRGEGWLEKPLSELCDIKHGFAFKSEFFTDNGDYVLLTPGNFYESGGYRDRGTKQKYYCGDIPSGFILEKNDLLVAMTEQAAGLLGSPILVPESGRFLHNQRLGLVTPQAGVPWLNEFFFHAFNTQAARKEIHGSASGVKVRHTSPTKIGEVVVAFPASIDEQRSIVSKFEELHDETQYLEALYQRKLEVLEELKQALLRQAFSGQL